MLPVLEGILEGFGAHPAGKGAPQKTDTAQIQAPSALS
jgi:hypothetical protein